MTQKTHGSEANAVETDFHSFVLKIWWEETESETPTPIWRGRITHVPSREFVLVKDMQGVLSFVQPFLGFQGDDAPPEQQFDVVMDRIQLDSDLEFSRRDKDH